MNVVEEDEDWYGTTEVVVIEVLTEIIGSQICHEIVEFLRKQNVNKNRTKNILLSNC